MSNEEMAKALAELKDDEQILANKRAVCAEMDRDIKGRRVELGLDNDGDGGAQ